MKAGSYWWIIFLCLANCFSLSAQKQGYEITFSFEKTTQPVLYIEGNYGTESFIFDSAKVKGKKTAVFKNKHRLFPDGIYSLTDGKTTTFFEFLIDNNAQFEVFAPTPADMHHAVVVGSDENTIFLQFQNEIESEDNIDNAILDKYIETAPHSLLAKYIKAQYVPLGIPSVFASDTLSDASAQYQFLLNHYFDQIDLNDVRLLRTPLDIGLKNYFKNVVIQKPDELIQETKKFLSKIENREVKNYYLMQLFDIFDDHVAVHDEPLVFLFDTYCPNANCEWIAADYKNIVLHKIERKKRTLPGAVIPPISAYNIYNQQVSTDSIGNAFLLLWLWDPDCDDCVEMTPLLYNFYKEFHNFYDLEIIAISITEDYERWKEFIDDHQLEWINLSYAVGEPNYDIVDYFDLVTTPCIFLINKNHTIIDRQFPLEDLHEILNKAKNTTTKE